jgi:hypothetical protein
MDRHLLLKPLGGVTRRSYLCCWIEGQIPRQRIRYPLLWIEIAQLLLNCKHARQCQEGTPLHDALFYGAKEIACLLLQKGGDIETKDQVTALFSCSWLSFMFLSIQSSSTRNFLCFLLQLESPLLHKASCDGGVETVSQLLETGADMEAKDAVRTKITLYFTLFTARQRMLYS